MTVAVSIVVPTYKRPDLLSRCLAALLAQDFDPAAYEIIVVDDAACPETRRLVQNLARPAGSNDCAPTVIAETDPELDLLAYSWLKSEYALAWEYAGPLPEPVIGSHRDTLLDQPPARLVEQKPRLRYIPVLGETHGPAAARNRGWRAARGSIIAFTDDDCIPQPGWLKAGTAAFTDDILGAMGRMVVPLSSHPTDYERDVAGLEVSKFVTANCFYRRDSLEEVGGFDERFEMAWREDSDLFFNLLNVAQRRGKSLVCVPEAVVVHPVRSARWGISLKLQRKSMFNALLYKKHPRLYRHYIQARPPWRYYLSQGALLVAVGATGTGMAGLALVAAGLWLLLTLWFCGERLHRTAWHPAHVFEMVVTSILIPPLSIFWRIIGAFKFRVLFF